MRPSLGRYERVVRPLRSVCIWVLHSGNSIPNEHPRLTAHGTIDRKDSAVLNSISRTTSLSVLNVRKQLIPPSDIQAGEKAASKMGFVRGLTIIPPHPSHR